MKSFGCQLNNVPEDTKLYIIISEVFASKKFEDHYFRKPSQRSACIMGRNGEKLGRPPVRRQLIFSRCKEFELYQVRIHGNEEKQTEIKSYKELGIISINPCFISS